eukprot:TRINITY_DN40491_c0_g1_i2.p1 TRINITY_DN40491_c0_g1~~TRINITY_DN40491_c0_g1_i2.p1  ORF type:complete len:224 (+),score=39.27 TRINITY_DN40491_c0_g1_i2:254-925(+)
MAVMSGFCSAVTAISARKAGQTSSWFLNMANTLIGCFAFAALPITPFVDEGEIRALRGSVYLACICIAANGVLFVFASGFTTGGAMLCPAAVSATVNVSSRLTLGYLADALIFGVSMDPLSLGGAALMLGAVLLMACARKPTEDTSASVAESTELGQPASAAAADADDTESLASFIAAEFVAEKGHQGGAYRRRTVADETPSSVSDRTLFGVPALGPPAARVL